MRFFSGRLTILLVLTLSLLFSFGGAASGEGVGSGWIDAPEDWWVSSYKNVTATEVRGVADGREDGTFGPAVAVTRGQFAKMATKGLGVPVLEPDEGTFADVLKSHIFYGYIEGGYATGLITGWDSNGAREFRPSITISRQQANSILARYLSQAELEAGGFIRGIGEQRYDSLDEWFEAEGRDFYLQGFIDWQEVAENHRATTAYLAYRDIVRGSGGKLSPKASLNRAQAAVMVVRLAKKAAEITSLPNVPTGVEVVPAGPSNNRTPHVKGLAAPGMNVVLFDTVGDVTSTITAVEVNAAGRFYIDVPPGKELEDGIHMFTCKTKNAQGIFSEPSASVVYVLDTVAPTGSIVSPALPEGASGVVVNVPKPVFRVRATDDRSGVATVDFQVSREEGGPWLSVSVANAPDEGDDLYTAVWPAGGALEDGLTDGDHLLRAVITDWAGNEYVTPHVTVTVDTEAHAGGSTEGLAPQGGSSVFCRMTMEGRRDS